MSWDMEVDFVSVGGGIGGLAGATVAAATGAKALVLEKDQLIGGVTAVSIGELWLAGTHLRVVLTSLLVNTHPPKLSANAA